MDVEGIAAVLSRASELRSKINNCIDRATSRERDEESSGLREGGEAEEEEESLLDIRDALESLEEQLASLQALQQQQRYEREATLAEIDHSRKFLLQKLKEYKGEDLEVIQEASAFAGETVEHDKDLLLPPYPSRLPDSLLMNETYTSQLHPIRSKFVWNGTIREAKQTSILDSEKPNHGPKNSTPSGIKSALSFAAKTMFAVVSVVTLLSIAGFEPKLRKRNNVFGFLGLYQKPHVEEKHSGNECPPGKVLVMENGEQRCLVKERVEVPFEPVVKTPDVSYGFG